MLRFVFVESSLETVPKSIAKHPAVISDAKRRKKKPTEMILDDSKHHTAMENLERREKRGRPDIVHQCLLLVLDSPIEELEVYVHTINDVVIWINRITRLPRNYNRFIGLMRDLFRKRVIETNGVKLMEVTDLNLKDVLSDLNVYVMSEKGERSDVRFRDCAVCIGAFPHGEFEDETLKVFEEVGARFISVSDRPLTALYTTCWVLGRGFSGRSL